MAESIEVENPYVRMRTPGAPATAAFMTINNTDGKDTALQPGGLHVMLINLNEPIKEGEKYRVDLTFGDGSTKLIEPMGMGMKSGNMGNGRNVNPMQLVMHANPAFPNLTSIAVKNAAELRLSAEQVKSLKAWAARFLQLNVLVMDNDVQANLSPMLIGNELMKSEQSGN
ncbi:copper chaperone PCu(A)C [Thiomicrorhabdus indica]|uniref:copper chaperone PCu(A)C n=1 Tax=Thiomicrorhabdus indica TaxID=2267253 RepID=UPI00197F2EE7|nr:copper chaperone PCu(A)C [Thiomicrorhabdus indica]